jgi:hypothetical protein
MYQRVQRKRALAAPIVVDPAPAVAAAGNLEAQK